MTAAFIFEMLFYIHEQTLLIIVTITIKQIKD